MRGTRSNGPGLSQNLSFIKGIDALKMNAADFGGHFHNSPEGVFIFDGKVTIPTYTSDRGSEPTRTQPPAMWCHNFTTSVCVRPGPSCQRHTFSWTAYVMLIDLPVLVN